MSVLRIIAGGLLALIACYVGLLIKRRYRDRANFFKSACEYASSMSSELSLNKTPIPEIAEKFAQGRKGDFEKLLSESIAIMKEGVSADKTDKVNVPILKAAEKKEVMTFLCGTGKSALSDQLAQVAHYKNLFEQKQKKCEEDSKRLGGMYFKLCVLLGLAILLILA